LPARIGTLIVRLKGEKAHWGARKIREFPVGRLDGEVRGPSNFSDLVRILDLVSTTIGCDPGN
jgi:hypothetical protein